MHRLQSTNTCNLHVKDKKMSTLHIEINDTQEIDMIASASLTDFAAGTCTSTCTSCCCK